MNNNNAQDELISHGIVQDVGNSVKKARGSRNLSIRELAHRSGLSATAIWKLEKGQMSPSIVLLSQIARGLGVKVTELIEPAAEEETVVYTPAGAQTMQLSDDIDVDTLSGSSRGWTVIAYLFTLKPGAKSGKRLSTMTHHGEELNYCLKGKVQYTIAGKKFVLKQGDAIHFKSGEPHSWQNIEPGISKILNIAVPPHTRT